MARFETKRRGEKREGEKREKEMTGGRREEKGGKRVREGGKKGGVGPGNVFQEIYMTGRSLRLPPSRPIHHR